MKTIDATTDLEDVIGEAIARSRSHDEIVRVIVTDRNAALTAVNARSESCEAVETDDMSTGKRMTDVWGDDGQGCEFRLHLVTA